MTSSATTAAPPPRPGKDCTAREMWQYAVDLLKTGHCDEWADLFAVDGVIEWPFGPPGVPKRMAGRDEIRRLLTPTQKQAHAVTRTRHSSVVIHDCLDPEVVIVEFDSNKEVIATGEKFTMPYLHVMRVRNGEIVLFRDYFNVAASHAALTATLDRMRTPTETGRG